MNNPGMTLAEQTARLLILAGIPWNDRGLRAIREHNGPAYARAGLPNPHAAATGGGQKQGGSR